MPLVERQYPSLSEHDYRIKGLPGLVFAFSESNRAHLCNLWNRVRTVIGDAKSIFNNQSPGVRYQDLKLLGEEPRMNTDKHK